MIEVTFDIWMASKTRWVHLTKKFMMPSVPRCGEFIKFKNSEMGDYFAWKVREVTYHESGSTLVSTELLDNQDDRNYSFEDENEFDEYYESYVSEGWSAPAGITKNLQYRSSV